MEVNKKVNQSHHRTEVSRVFQEVKVPRLRDNSPRWWLRLSALRIGCILAPGNTPSTHFCQRLNRTQGHSAIGRITSMKNSNDTIWNRTSDFPICSHSALTTVLPRSPPIWKVAVNILNKQSRIADKGWSSSLGVGRGAKVLCTKRPQTWTNRSV